ncbi:hypothetical protein BHM03_00015081 [Ensete ventricosum]|nr:hypothetical protein BHM03_00015081 [Ensete ventricosum]
MGCTASRLENEDCVRRCKERRRLMKEAVHSRHHLASAHSDYLRSLRLTGSALTRFALGEPLAVSEQTPPVLLRSSFAASATSSFPPPTPQPPPAPSPPAPPPRRRPRRHHDFSPSPSPSIVSSSASFRKPSTAAAASDAGHSGFPPRNSTYATTPSQSSSAWDWTKCYPPSPPNSEFFERRKTELEEKNRLRHHLPPEEEVDESDEEHVAPAEEGRGGREEVYCREWGEHCTSPTSSSTRSDGEPQREEDREDVRDTVSTSESTATRSEYAPSQAAPSEVASSAAAEVKTRLRPRSEAGSSSARWKGGVQETTSSFAAAAELPMVVRHHNLAEIAAAIEGYFIKAADAGSAVSDLLEIGRAQFDGSFRQLKSKCGAPMFRNRPALHVLSALSSSWTSKPPLAIRYRLDTAALEESGGGKSHISTLERLLAWEKKLSEEIEHEKKLSTLQSQEYSGKEDAKLDKTKASIKKLQSLIIVTSQAVTTTSSAITKVRDDELAPQLVQICYA